VSHHLGPLNLGASSGQRTATPGPSHVPHRAPYTSTVATPGFAVAPERRQRLESVHYYRTEQLIVQQRCQVLLFRIPNLFAICIDIFDGLCGLVVRVLGYRSGGSGSIPGTTRKKNSERGPLSLVTTSKELLVRKVAAPV
jgi:hypothetical protein